MNGGPEEQPGNGGGPLRRCIVSGEQRPQAEMLRFVAGPDGQLVFDAAAKLPGRGLWLSARLDMLKPAAAKNLFAKAARQRIELPDDLVETVTKALRRRCLEKIGLARRAGQLTAGFEKVREALKKAPAGLLIEAADGAEDGKRKLAALAPGVPVAALFSAAELGQAIGRDNAVHMCVAPGRLAEGLLTDTRRLAGVLNVELDGNAGPGPETE